MELSALSTVEDVVHTLPFGNRGRPGSPGCHEESEARMVKVNLLTLSASPRRLKSTVVSVARPTNTSATYNKTLIPEIQSQDGVQRDIDCRGRGSGLGFRLRVSGFCCRVSGA